MTLSPDSQIADRHAVLRALFCEVGDRLAAEVDLALNRPPLAAALPTTVRWLERQGCIEMIAMGGLYAFTLYGWRYTLEEVLTEDEQGEHLERWTRVTRVLKALVKDRTDDQEARLADIAEAAAVPEDWLYNAIASGWYSAVRAGDRHYEVTLDGLFVMIPVDFGCLR